MKPRSGFLRYLLASFVVVVGIGTTTTLTMVYAAENKTTTAVNVGVVLDLSSWAGKMSLSCINMSLSDFYSSHPHHTTTIVLHIRDSKADVVEAAAQAVDLLQNSEVEVILGPESSSQAYFIIQLGERAEVPIISFSTTTSALSHLRSSYLFRVAQDESYQVYAINDIIKAFGWRQVVAIYQDDVFGKGIVADLMEALQDVNVHVHRSVIDPTAFGKRQIEEEIYRLRMMQTRVFIVHMVHSLANQVLAKANELGMMRKGYVWILTDATTNVLNTMNSSILNSMQGVLGVKTYVPRTPKRDNFVTRWRRKFGPDNPDIANPQLDVTGLWAYDATWALAMAVERLGTDPNFTCSKLTKLKTSRVSENGKKICDSLSKTKFKGLSGEFSLVKGQLESPNLEIVNVIGDGERTVGYWTPEMGLIRDFNQKGTKPIIWPGDSTALKGRESPSNGEKKLRIGVALNAGFSEFARDIGNGTIIGYCIDIFEAVVAELPFGPPHDYIPMMQGSTYDDLMVQVSKGYFDAAIGDITILANRTYFVDFSLPFTQAGIAVVVPIRHDSRDHAWLFLKPLTWELWITSLCFFVFMGFLVWILEHRNNEDFRGSLSHQIGTSLWFSFCAIVWPQRETLTSNLARFVVVIWLFVVFLLTQSYTASLTSWLTVQQLQPATDINQIVRNNMRVGYQGGSYVSDILRLLGIKVLVPYNSTEQLHELFTKGGCNGGIDAAIDEVPYMRLFLSRYSDNYTMADYQWNTNGFGFAFPTGSPLVDDISKAIVHVTESDNVKKIEEKWYGKKTNHPFYGGGGGGSEASSSILDLSYFRSLFLITASVAIFALILYFLPFLRNQSIHFDSTIWRRIIATFHIFMIKDSRQDSRIDSEPQAVVVEAVVVEASPTPTTNALSIPSNDDVSIERFKQFGDSSKGNQTSNIV